VLNQALRARLLTSAWLVPAVIASVLLLPAALFAVVMAVVVLLAAWEWGPLVGIEARRARVAMACVLALVLAWLWFHAAQWSLVLAAAALWWLVFALLLPMLHPHPVSHGVDKVLLPLGLLVLAPPWLALVWLHGCCEYGPRLVLGLLMMIWIGDSAAYFAGGRFGRRKLAPRVSPGKTWVGLYAALVVVSAAVLLTAFLSGLGGPQALLLMLLGAVTLAFSVVGDLFESWLKRRRGIKDSGALLPGHGGMLDRIDSMTAAAPIFALGLTWLGVAA
jgi:phosphatidate cytidylyltransferase